MLDLCGAERIDFITLYIASFGIVHLGVGCKLMCF